MNKTSANNLTQFLPHSGNMVLLASVTDYDTSAIVCVSHSLSPDNPLMHNGQILSLNLIEYAAQTAAIHQGLSQASEIEQPPSTFGVLATIKNIELHCETLPLHHPLTVQASVRSQSAAGCSYQFAVSSHGDSLGSGVLTIAFQSKAS